MKTFRVSAFVILLTCFAVEFTASAQARKLTRRVVNPDNTLVQPSQPGAPATPAPPATPRITTTPPPLPILTNVVPEKTKEQKDEMLRKTIEFQKKRAESGAPSAQYDLGMRYLTGDGLEKDPKLARKWLYSSATNGNSQAVKKLKELDKKDLDKKELEKKELEKK